MVDPQDLTSDSNFLNNEAIVTSPWEASFVVMQFSNIIKIMLETMSAEEVPNPEHVELMLLHLQAALSHAALKSHFCGEFWRVVLLVFDVVPQLKAQLSPLVKEHTNIDPDEPGFAKNLLDYALALNPANTRIQKEIEFITTEQN